MAQTAKAETETPVEKAAATVSEIGRRAAERAGEASRQAAGKAEEMAETTAKTAWQAGAAAVETGETLGRRSIEGFAEVGQLLADLAAEQNRHGLATFRALTGTLDWNEATQIQAEFVRSSIERFTTFHRHYLETLQAIGTVALTSARERAEALSQR
jgi:hypothetical protein